jgi:hypothetical protein
MFSTAPRAPERLEIVYSGENFTWREDESVAARRVVDRKRRFLATCIAIAFTAIVLGPSFGLACLVTAAAGTVSIP